MTGEEPLAQQPPADDADQVIRNPLNGEPMVKIRIGGVTIDRCPKTGAIWLDRGELAALAGLTGADKKKIRELDTPIPGVAMKRSKRGPLTGPRSGAVMMVIHDPKQKHVEFEVDPESGGCFFDAGELSDLTNYTFRERLRTLMS